MIREVLLAVLIVYRFRSAHLVFSWAGTPVLGDLDRLLVLVVDPDHVTSEAMWGRVQPINAAWFSDECPILVLFALVY